MSTVHPSSMLVTKKSPSLRVASQSVKTPTATIPFKSDTQRLDRDLTSLLDSLIGQYVHLVSSDELARIDAETFVNWLAEQSSIDVEQRDLVACLFSRHSVESISLSKRLVQARFEELAMRGMQRWQRRMLKSGTEIELNPTHVWATLQTRLLLETTEPLPAEVLFFQVAGEVQTAVIETELAPVLKSLNRGALPTRMVLRHLDAALGDRWLDRLQELLALKILAIK
ncbi:hypothetical protein [Planctomicrobium piriforme]|uniref:Uncharacterized protein n=1 Tax=Planctomicrobium piriforme TaxID=1576369 RepID=A0A1I3HEY4_9PLAN|nr:hypothetical protein [Planctomicrobium piriforme]SFI34232.1 hypothetical protein SAMN05421753_10833 [Planctomicrobium piriforme]